MAKKLSLGPNLSPFWLKFGPQIWSIWFFLKFGPKFGFFFFFFKNLASSVSRYHGQLSSCTISEKTNDPILRKISDGQTDGLAEGRE